MSVLVLHKIGKNYRLSRKTLDFFDNSDKDNLFWVEWLLVVAGLFEFLLDYFGVMFGFNVSDCFGVSMAVWSFRCTESAEVTVAHTLQSYHKHSLIK